jgi:alpha-acetolactate decarboxylase
VKVEIDYTTEFYMVLPEGKEFYELDLTKEKQEELEKVER